MQVVPRRGFILQDFEKTPLWLPDCLLAPGRLAGFLVHSIPAVTKGFGAFVRSNIHSAQGSITEKQLPAVGVGVEGSPPPLKLANI